MKRLYILYALLLLVDLPLHAQIDRSQPPLPAKAKKVEIGNYQTFTLKNGLTVILVENHKLPIVSFSLQLDLDPILEKEIAGTASLAGSLLRTGTTTRTREVIDEEIDFIGATLGTSSGGAFGSSLKKHQDKLLEIFTDVLFHPVFPNEEFEKQRKQTLSALQFSSTDAGSMASTVAPVLRYGLNHPYGEPVTEQTVGNVTLDGIRNYYTTYFQPSAAYLVMVGDLTLPESKKLAEKYFSGWKGKKVPKHTYPDPPAITSNTVAFVDKPGAVQSVIKITHPLILKPGTPDVIPASFMNSVLGGGVFSGRLMMNLREDKAYTYGAVSTLSQDRLVGYFEAGAQVRNSVTDSAIVEFFYEIRRIQEELISEEDLQLNKNVMAGQFARSLESPETVARFALNTIRYKLPQDYYSTYLEKIDRITREDVRNMAKKYLHPDQCIILVVGNIAQVAEKLVPFSNEGQVHIYDRYGSPVVPSAEEIPEGMDASQVIDQYIKAIGGSGAVSNIRQITRTAKGSVEAMGRQVEIDMTTWQVAPNWVALEMKMGNMLLSKQVYDGKRSFITGMQGASELEGDDLEKMKYESYMFPELFYHHLPYTLTLEGVEKLNGERVYVVKIINPAGTSQKEYFSAESGLKIRTITSQDTPQGPFETIIDYLKYEESGGVLFPFEMNQQAGPQSINIKVVKLDTQTPVSGEVFKK